MEVIDPEQPPIGLTLFPIPARQTITIQLTGGNEEETSEMMVIDLSGSMMDKRKIKGKETTLILQEYPVGNYFIRITNKAFLLTFRFPKH